VDLSIGLTSADSDDAETLIADADEAMYAVKRAGRED
jgi:GGDEF domain-containing protein